MDTQEELKRKIYFAIQEDAYDVLGLTNRPFLRTVLNPLLKLVFRRFAEFLSSFEGDVDRLGFKQAVTGRLPRFVQELEVAGLENIPAIGPLLLTSNHPAAYDAFAIASILPRDDLKIVATDIDLVDHLPATSQHFTFIGKASQPNVHRRMSGVRESIRHLRQGGALLLFPSGLVDPDPAISDQAAESFQNWRPGIEILLRKVPETIVVVTIVSGVLSERWLKSPVTRLRKEPHNRQKVAEVFQVIEQLLFPGRLRLAPKISFSRSITYESILQDAGSSESLPYLISEAEQLLTQHQNQFNIT